MLQRHRQPHKRLPAIVAVAVLPPVVQAATEAVVVAAMEMAAVSRREKNALAILARKRKE